MDAAIDMLAVFCTVTFVWGCYWLGSWLWDLLADLEDTDDRPRRMG